MANSLVDFVVSLVRDPEAAARFDENPGRAIADADLTGVTAADVHSLIPVVTESLSTGAPVAGTDMGADSNVWASGAATAAFDAFSDIVPEHTIDDGHSVAGTLIDQPVDHSALDHGADLLDAHAGGLGDSVDDFHIDDSEPAFHEQGAVDQSFLEDHDLGAEAPNFDIFE